MTEPPGPGAEERLRQLESVTDVALAHLDVETLLSELLARVGQILDVDTAAVLLLDRLASDLVATAAHGIEEEVRQGVRVPMNRGFAGRVAGEKRPIVLDRVDETTVVNPLLRAKGIQTMLGVPILDAGEVVGVLHVGSLRSRTFSEEDIDLLQRVADRVCSATRPRLAAIERDAALALQRGLLPAGLPEIPDLALAARYVPGGGGAVGGDWYDVFRLVGGGIGVVIGDVSGHGLHAAVVMGRVRSALRAYALESRDPGEVLRRLDLKLQHFEAGEMVTVLYAVVEPPFDEVLVSCAGHVPPVLHPGAGAVARLVDVAVDPPLGVRPSGGRRTTAVPFPPGALLCLYTDGLVEHRGELIDDGIDRLRDALGAGPPEAACAEVMARLVGTATVEDDVALLIVQRSPSAGEHRPLELHLEAHPASLARFRSAARPWLARTGASAEAVEEVLLAVGEAASNAVEHAYGPDGGAVTVHLERDGHSIVATVQDRGRWRTSRAAGRGRGLLIMERWSDELRIERGAEGTTVVLRRSVGPGDVG